jgi:hypothetical protein
LLSSTINVVSISELFVVSPPSHLKEPSHDITRQPACGVKARSGAERSKAVGTADSLRGRQAAAQPVADEGPHGVGIRSGIPYFPPSLTCAAIVNGNRPVIEQVAADRYCVTPMMILLSIMGL